MEINNNDNNDIIFVFAAEAITIDGSVTKIKVNIPTVVPNAAMNNKTTKIKGNSKFFANSGAPKPKTQITKINAIELNIDPTLIRLAKLEKIFFSHTHNHEESLHTLSNHTHDVLSGGSPAHTHSTSGAKSGITSSKLDNPDGYSPKKILKGEKLLAIFPTNRFEDGIVFICK